MRRSRFLLPFTLGAISMLAVVAALVWAAPGLLDLVRAAPGPREAPPGAAPGPARAGLAPAEPAAPRDEPEPAAESAAGAGLLVPVRGVEAADLVDTYEQARGEGRSHDAIDIPAPRGTPVVAASEGVVLKLFQSARGGTALYQLGPDRRTIYYYAHLDRYAPGMVEGRALRRGEVLGYVGDTGDAGAGNYHLHFEVTTTTDPARYWGGVPQNPYPLLR